MPGQKTGFPAQVTSKIILSTDGQNQKCSSESTQYGGATLPNICPTRLNKLILIYTVRNCHKGLFKLVADLKYIKVMSISVSIVIEIRIENK